MLWLLRRVVANNHPARGVRRERPGALRASSMKTVWEISSASARCSPGGVPPSEPGRDAGQRGPGRRTRIGVGRIPEGVPSLAYRQRAFYRIIPSEPAKRDKVFGVPLTMRGGLPFGARMEA